MMHLRLETEGVISHVLGHVFPPPPSLPSGLPLPSASPSRAGGGVGAGCPVGSPAPFFWMSGDSFEHTPPSQAPDVGGSDSGISLDDNIDMFAPGSPAMSACVASPGFSACSAAPFSFSAASDIFPSDLESDDGTAPSSPRPSAAARQGPKRRRDGPVAANRSSFLVRRKTAAEHAVGQIKGAIRDRTRRTRKPAKPDPKRPVTASNSRVSFSVPDIAARGHDVWITLCSESKHCTATS